MEQVQYVQNVLQDVVATLLLNKPEEPVPEVIQFLQDIKKNGAPPLTKEERLELNALRDENDKLDQTAKKSGKKVKREESSSDSDTGAKKPQDHSSSDSECDDVAPLDISKNLQMAKKSRTSVSAEVFGKFNVKAAFKP